VCVAKAPLGSLNARDAMTTPMQPAANAVSKKSDARSRFLETFRRECATTRKVLDAFPADKADFQPHDRSNSAVRLAGTFALEGMLALKALRGEPFGSSPPPFPTQWADAVRAFDDVRRELEAEVEKASPHLEGTVKFPTGPKQMGDYSLEDFLWFMLHDQIHHRGQLSVYVRMAGGKVPSIYGPSADEPWR